MDVATFKRKVRRVIADPSLVLTRLRQSTARQRTAPPGPANLARVGLDQRLAEIAAAGHRNVAVVGDGEPATTARARLEASHVAWVSSSFASISDGAAPLLQTDLARFDAVLVLGPNVATDYRYAVSRLVDCNPVPAIYWVSDRFEYCGGTVPVPADCSDADAIVSNHFPDMFGNWDPLLVRVETFDQASEVTRWLLLRPRETVRVRLSEWLPQRQGPAAIVHYCAHPRLTHGRHSRWRSTTVHYWNGSASMVHGAHDFRGGQPVHEFKLGARMIRSGGMVFSLGNYDRSAGEAEQTVDVLAGREREQWTRRTDARVDETRIDHVATDGAFDSYLGVRYRGYGGSFWFALDDGAESSGHASLAANHSVRSALVDSSDELPPLADDARRFADTLRAQGLMLMPHGVPVTPKESAVEFGFEFDENVPPLRRFVLRLFDGDGSLVGEKEFEKRTQGPVFADELLRQVGWDNVDAGLLMVSPDWIDSGLDPRGRGAVGNLLARHRQTADFDATEFQSSWRNLHVRVDELPHWLAQERMLICRSKLLCGVNGADDGASVGLSLLNGSGNLAYDRSAGVRLTLLNRSGGELSTQTTLRPFEARVVWLDALMPSWRDHLESGYGTVFVQSGDADLNANVVTVWNDRAVSLQHMWGY